MALLLVWGARIQLAEPRVHRAIGQVLGETTDLRVDAPRSPAMLDRAMLATIRDNTPFRDEEQPAWFALLRLLSEGSEGLASPSQVGYAALVASPDAYRGRPVEVSGVVRRTTSVTPAENRLGLETLHRITLQGEGGEVWPLTLYTIEPPTVAEGEPTRATGYFFKNLSYRWEGGVGTTPVILARRLGKRPHTPTEPTAVLPPQDDWPGAAKAMASEDPLGKALLTELGIDLPRFMAARDQHPLSADEAAPFYATLQAIQEIPAKQLDRLAWGGLTAYVDRHANPQGDASRRQQQVSEAIRQQAKRARYSVAPLFLDGAAQRSELLSFDAVVRRVVRIEADPVGHYYELEAFAEDSQNLPLVFCMAELPPGFPVGEAIRQPARLTGFFFKQWLYRSRHRTDAGGDAARYAPLLIGRAPSPLEADGPPARPGWGVGLAGVGLLLAALLLVVWFHYDDRKARSAERPANDFSHLP